VIKITVAIAKTFMGHLVDPFCATNYRQKGTFPAIS
jgi:hypothetical protein